MTQSRKWIIGTAIAVVVILAAGWFLLAKPEKQKVTDLNAQTTAQQQANSILLTQISALQAQQKLLPQQQLILQKFSTEVPDTAAEPTLIRQLSSAANGANVDLGTITPGAATTLSTASATGGQTLGSTGTAATPAQLMSLPLTLAISGTYANIEAFFNSLERLPRALLVSAFSVSPGSVSTTGQNVLAASLTAAVFYAPGVTPPPAVTPTVAPSASTPPATSTAPTTPAAPATPAGTGTNPTPASSISRPPLPVEQG